MSDNPVEHDADSDVLSQNSSHKGTIQAKDVYTAWHLLHSSLLINKFLSEGTGW